MRMPGCDIGALETDVRPGGGAKMFPPLSAAPHQERADGLPGRGLFSDLGRNGHDQPITAFLGKARLKEQILEPSGKVLPSSGCAAKHRCQAVKRQTSSAHGARGLEQALQRFEIVLGYSGAVNNGLVGELVSQGLNCYSNSFATLFLLSDWFVTQERRSQFV